MKRSKENLERYKVQSIKVIFFNLDHSVNIQVNIGQGNGQQLKLKKLTSGEADRLGESSRAPSLSQVIF